ncbi:hypothetical protein ACJ77P_10280 [Syntrophus buswellii]|jgi:hypothetical protein|uniref:hypothetical protein n=1 Tax=Syntrophus buswellii TaxID=43774 RepID=UPI0038D3F305
MFLDIPGLSLPDNMKLHAFTDDPRVREGFGRRPEDLIPLGESSWPDEVKEKIVKIYQTCGLPDPLRQKLIEPTARVFRNELIWNPNDLSNVNWEIAVDYFTWEAVAISGNDKKSKRLQKKAVKKYGGIFMHYPVYEDYGGR